MSRTLLITVATILAARLSTGPDLVKHRDRFRGRDSIQTLAPEVLRSLPGHDCGKRPVGEPQCKLTELGTLGGSRWLWFREDARVDGVPTSSGRLLRVGPDSSMTSVWGLAAEGASVWDAALLPRAEGALLHVPVRYPGTGAFRDDLLFRWAHGRWEEIDTVGWTRSIHLPPCYGLWKGPFLDFETLTLEMPVWIEGDGNCCPTGGNLEVRFAIRGDVLAVEEWKHIRGPDDGSPWDGRDIDTAKCGPKPP